MIPRFIAIRLGPQPDETEHGIVDTHTRTLICRGSDEEVAETIAAMLEQSHTSNQASEMVSLADLAEANAAP